MASFDVFNGDADGLCALHQLRLAEPRDSVLVTGVKREIALLKKVQASSGDHITVLDISLDKNREALQNLLTRRCTGNLCGSSLCLRNPGSSRLACGHRSFSRRLYQFAGG